MKALFNTLFYNPMFEGLLFIYDLIGAEGLGLSIIILTIIIRIVLSPFFYKGAKNQTLMQRLQPEMNRIKKKFKDNKEEQAKAMMGLYKEHNLNPFSSFLLLIIQLPIFLALFQIFRNSETIITNFGDPLFLGIHLAEASIVLAIVAAILQYFQGKLALAKSSNESSSKQQKNIGKAMIYFAPIISLVILTTLPSALALYWIVSTLFSIGQQIIINNTLDKKNNNESSK
ncbi:MAG: YidC/Oxa1 family membrane protein insertase, partial [Candidatus Paceibacterota bacterium]